MNYLKVAMYPIIVCFSALIIELNWKRYENHWLLIKKNGKRIKLCSAILLSAIIGIYSLSFNHTFWWTDVGYYDIFFSSGKAFPDSIGLNAIYSILHCFTTNIDVLLFTISFLASLIMFLAYNKFEEAYPLSLKYMFFTTFFIAICQVSLKQAIACGLATMSINEMIKNRNIRAVLFAVLAGCFHVTAGPILVMTFISIKAIKITSIRLRFIVYLVIISSIVFFQHIFQILGSVSSVFPQFADKLIEYSSSGYLENSSTGLVALKGLPYYLITVIGIIKRKNGRIYIKEYDSYLTVSFIASISFFMSFYSYWLSRVIAYFWMVDLVFLGMLCLNENIKDNNSKLYRLIVGGMMMLLTFRELIQIYITKYGY